MLSERLRPVIEPITSGAGRALARAHLTPNALTAIGLVAVLACAWVIATGEIALGGLLLIPAVLLDVLDGALARATNRVTAWGGFFDSVCDRVADGALLGAIAWAAVGSGDRGILRAALIATVTSFVVPYARAKAEAMGIRPSSGPGERAERYVVIVVGLLFDVLEPALWIVIALTTYTAITRSLAVRRATTD